jgi:Glycosyl transferases group 1
MADLLDKQDPQGSPPLKSRVVAPAVRDWPLQRPVTQNRAVPQTTSGPAANCTPPEAAPQPAQALPPAVWAPTREALPLSFPLEQRAPATTVATGATAAPRQFVSTPTAQASPSAPILTTATAQVSAQSSGSQHSGQAIVETRKSQLESELGVLRREMNRLQSAKHATDYELLESRRTITAFEHRVVKVKSTISYQLGSALVQSNKSWKGIMRLPSALLGVYRASRTLRRRSGKEKQAGDLSFTRSTEAVDFIKSALARVDQHGGEAAVAWAKASTTKPSVLAYSYIEIGRAIARDHPQLAGTLGVAALELYPIEQRAKALAFLLGECGHVRHAVALLEKSEAAGLDLTPSEAKNAGYLRALARLLAAPLDVPSRARELAPLQPLPGASLHVAIFGREALPFNVSATALRLHERANAARQAGWEATVITPPGYPATVRAQISRPDNGQQIKIDGAHYMRLMRDEQPEEDVDLTISATAASFASAAVAAGACLMQADATPVDGLAAALAARTLGLPLALEVDDLMDPHLPYVPGLERTEKGQVLLSLTMAAMRAADVCRVHHPGLVSFVEHAGLTRDRITYMPYRFAEQPADADVAALGRQIGVTGSPVIGVVRDLCDSYDSLVLVDLLAALTERVQGLKLLIVGQGRGGDALKARANELGLANSMIWINRPDPKRMQHYRTLMDVTVFTRRDTPRAALQSAYEVQAALACGRAIVAYRTADTRGIVEDGTTGWLCAPGDTSELKHKVSTLLGQPETRRTLGAAARAAYLQATNTSSDDPLTGLPPSSGGARGLPEVEISLPDH